MESKNKYVKVLREIHETTSPIITLMSMFKLDVTYSTLFFAIAIILRFNGILIICGNFQTSLEVFKTEITISQYLKYVTSHELVKLLGLNNLYYCIISLIIFFLFLLRLFICIRNYRKIKKRENIEDVSIPKYQAIMEHVIFFFHPFLIEYLSFIVFIYIFPNSFLIKKDANNVLNIITLIVNIFLIIIYNGNGIIHFFVINRPTDEESPIKYRYPNLKFYTIFFMQNLVIIESIENYFTSDSVLYAYKIVLLVVLNFIFLAFFFTSIKRFNYNNFINNLIGSLATFSSFSFIVECVVDIFKYQVNSVRTMIFFNFFKILLSVYFIYITNVINRIYLKESTGNELFKVYKEKIRNPKVYDSFLFVHDMMLKLKNKENDIVSQNFVKIVKDHKDTCANLHCKCRLLEIIPYGENYEKNYINNFIERCSFLVETCFISLDFYEDYDLTLLLSEHFCYFNKNPLMAYSMIQTILHLRESSLSTSQKLILYETALIYVKITKDPNILIKKGDLSYEDIDVKNYDNENINNNEDKESLNESKEKIRECKEKKKIQEKNQEKEYVYLYGLIEKMRNIMEIMEKYANIYVEVVKYKELMEDTIKIEREEESGDIKGVSCPQISQEYFEKVIDMLKRETTEYEKIKKALTKITTEKMPIEFYYKVYLFFDLFMHGKVDDNLLNSVYGFTTDRSLYSNYLNPNVMMLLKQRYRSRYHSNDSVFFIIFKYEKGLLIEYLTEELTQFLGYKQDELLNKNIGVLMPEKIAAAHDKMVLSMLHSRQNLNFDGTSFHLFNKDEMMIPAIGKGTCIPGLSFNLNIVFGIQIKSNKEDLLVMLDKSFQEVSISSYFEEKLNINFDMLSRLQISLQKLFNINIPKIKEHFEKFNKDLNQYKYSLDINPSEYFCKKLYGYDNILNIRENGYALIDDLAKSAEGNGASTRYTKVLRKSKREIEKIYNHKEIKKVDNAYFFYDLPKKDYFQNVAKMFDDINEVELALNKNLRILHNIASKMKNRFFYEEILKSEDYFRIEIKLNVLYDLPFYIMKIKEVGISGNKIINKMSFEGLKIPPSKKAKIIEPNTSSKSEEISFHSNSKSGTQETGKRNGPKRRDLQSYAYDPGCASYVVYIIILLMLSLLIFYMVILFYQNNMITISNKIFYGLYWNYVQRDKLVYLNSVIQTGCFKFNGLVDYSEEILPIIECQQMLKIGADKYLNSFHKLYSYYLDYKKSIGKSNKGIFSEIQGQKLVLNWNISNFTSNYIKEGEYIAYLSLTEFYLPKNITYVAQFRKDLEIFFKRSYIKNIENREKELQSTLMVLYFHINRNYENYSAYFANIQKECEKDFKEYSDKTKRVYISLEVIANILAISFFGSTFFYLYTANHTLYRDLVLLFIDREKEGAYVFKNHKENFVVLRKLAEFIGLITNFDLKNAENFNLKLTNTLLDNDDLNMSIINIDKPIKKDNKFKLEREPSIDKIKRKGNNSKSNLAELSRSDLSNTKSNFLNQSSMSNLTGPSTRDNLISKLNAESTIGKNKKSRRNINPNNINQINNMSNNSNTTENNIENGYEKLTADNIVQYTQRVNIKIIVTFLIILIILLIILIVYFVIKFVISLSYCNDIDNIFNDFGVLTYTYTMVYYYFNNLRLFLLNEDLGNSIIFETMLNTTIDQDEKLSEIQHKRIKNYKRTYETFIALNGGKEDIGVYICGEDIKCLRIVNSEYNIFKNGVLTGLNAMKMQIRNFFLDYNRSITNNNPLIEKLEDIKEHYNNIEFKSIDLSLYYVMYRLEDIVHDSFYEDSLDLQRKFKLQITMLNFFSIAFSTLASLFIIIFVLSMVRNLVRTVFSGTSRLNSSIFFMRDRYMGKVKESTTTII